MRSLLSQNASARLLRRDKIFEITVLMIIVLALVMMHIISRTMRAGGYCSIMYYIKQRKQREAVVGSGYGIEAWST